MPLFFLYPFQRFFKCAALLGVLLLTACLGSVAHIPKTPIAAPVTIPAVRAPAVGQQWVYEVRNFFNGELAGRADDFDHLRPIHIDHSYELIINQL